MGTQTASGTKFIYNHWSKLIQFYGLFLEGANIVAGAAQGKLLIPGNTCMLIDDSQSHPGFLLAYP